MWVQRVGERGFPVQLLGTEPHAEDLPLIKAVKSGNCRRTCLKFKRRTLRTAYGPRHRLYHHRAQRKHSGFNKY